MTHEKVSVVITNELLGSGNCGLRHRDISGRQKTFGKKVDTDSNYSCCCIDKFRKNYVSLDGTIEFSIALLFFCNCPDNLYGLQLLLRGSI